MTADVMSLARDVAATIVAQTRAEKVYVAAVSETRTSTFMCTLCHASGTIPGLGPFILGTRAGWGRFPPDPSTTGWPQLLESLKPE
ncbi:MAG: hypothetical protein V9F03_08330 [Microthrixaceae bacterium]